jgi:hypothetical protein
MMLIESFGIALRSLRANKMRSFLTMLGIIIGVASVITMVAVGAGAQTQVAEQIRSLGANVLMVVPGAARDGGVRRESGSRHTLTESDAAAIGSQLLQVQAAAPSIRGPHQIVRGGKNRQRHHRRLFRRPRLAARLRAPVLARRGAGRRQGGADRRHRRKTAVRQGRPGRWRDPHLERAVRGRRRALREGAVGRRAEPG